MSKYNRTVWTEQRNALLLKLKAAGMENTDIATRFGVRPEAVSAQFRKLRRADKAKRLREAAEANSAG